MNQTIAQTNEEEWLKVLGKGMVTLPKKWRDALGIETGDIVKAKKQGDTVVIEPQKINNAPYRVYTDKEIEEFLKEDTIPEDLAKKADAHIANLSAHK